MPPEQQLCDLLVVGAGPAGCVAAATAAGEGVNTILVDSKPRIGENPHCGEFIPARLFTEFSLEAASIIQSVHDMESRILLTRSFGFDDGFSPGNKIACLGSGPGGKLTEDLVSKVIQSSGYVVDRVRFDRDLAREAAHRGAYVSCRTKLTGYDNGYWILHTGSRKWSVKAKFVVAADGALSTVARLLGLPKSRFLMGTQVEVPVARPIDRTLVFFHRNFFGGYGWLFPKGKAANVGIGILSGKEIRPGGVLDSFVKYLCELTLIRPGRLALTGGLIPISGLRDALVVGNVLFCGDAAGLTHPITGAGIPQALESGTLAGRAVGDLLRSGNRNCLTDYEREVKSKYSGVIGHALSKRRVMMEQWSDSDFAGLCANSWIAFPGYRKRVREQ